MQRATVVLRVAVVESAERCEEKANTMVLADFRSLRSDTVRTGFGRVQA
jgi:hypothetical protein